MKNYNNVKMMSVLKIVCGDDLWIDHVAKVCSLDIRVVSFSVWW